MGYDGQWNGMRVDGTVQIDGFIKDTCWWSLLLRFVRKGHLLLQYVQIPKIDNLRRRIFRVDSNYCAAKSQVKF
jgi:hypothetical protein